MFEASRMLRICLAHVSAAQPPQSARGLPIAAVYSTYRAENDPARPMLRALRGFR